MNGGSNVLWGFSVDPPYFGYNYAGQENPVFKFQESSRTQIDLGFLEH
jgi:hypothetical protein